MMKKECLINELDASSEKRLDVFDFLKGFAIFLVVMGHFLAWSRPENVELPRGAYFVKHMIYAFHMPLFFFISGCLVDLKKREWNFANVVFLIRRRTVSLILPGMTFMILFWTWIGTLRFEWFLQALFEIYLVFSLAKYICFKFKFGNLKEFMALLFFWGIIFVGSKCSSMGKCADFFMLTTIFFKYPFFLLGYYFQKFNWKQHLEKHNWIYSISIIAFGLLFYLVHYTDVTFKYTINQVLALMGIIICLGSTLDFNNGKFGRIRLFFLKMGKNSLAIYLMSPLLIPCLPELGLYFAKLDAYEIIGLPGAAHVTSIFAQLVSGILVSVYVCVACLGIKRILCKSKWLSLLMFGKKCK